jgi:hypothetical protein
MQQNNELIYSSQVKKNIQKSILFLTNKIDGLGLPAKEVATKLEIAETLISDIKSDRKEISNKAIEKGIVSRLINIYKVNPDFIYKGEGKIIRSFDGNVVSEERASYGNKEYEIQSLEKDITMLKEEIRHLNKASLLKDEIIAQLKENKQILEQKLKKSGIKSGIGNN